MKHLISIVLFCVLASAKASENDPIIINTQLPCYDSEFLFKTLKTEFKETPIIYGSANDRATSTMSLWSNLQNKSWTIVATKGDISCVIGAGSDLKVLPLRLGKPTSSML